MSTEQLGIEALQEETNEELLEESTSEDEKVQKRPYASPTVRTVPLGKLTA